MKLTALTALVFLFLAGCASSAKTGESPGRFDHVSAESLIAAVEAGAAPPDALVLAVRNGPLCLEDFSPQAVANYLEILAHERMLSLVPGEFCDSDEILVAFETVFEDMENIFHNWAAYKAYLSRVYRAGLG